MAIITPPTITPAPTPAPQRNDPVTFSDRVDAFVTWLIAAVAQFGALATNVYNNAVEAFNYANIASASAAYATSATGVIAWVSGTTYGVGDMRFSLINFQTYRRTTVGAGTTDPSLDTTNWGPPVQLGLQGYIASLTPGSPVTWTCPNGVHVVEYEVQDGGYSSGTSTGGSSAAGRGGNGGRGYFNPTVGVTYTLTAGAGGVGGAAGTNLAPAAGAGSTISGTGLTTITSANATIKVEGGAALAIGAGLPGASMMSVVGSTTAGARIGGGGSSVSSGAAAAQGQAGAVILYF